MKFKLPYYDRKIEKLQNELDNTKTELEILKSNQNNPVRLDDEQLQNFCIILIMILKKL